MIAQRFSALRARDERALVAFVTAGDPDLAALLDILCALEEGGADIVEIGIPFSDPIADGPTIQASSQRALDRGVTPRAVLEKITEFRSTHPESQLPIVVMGYLNPILRMTELGFAQASKEAGIQGVIVCDVIPEEAESWIRAARQADINTIFLAAPTSVDERLDAVCESATGFVYAVSRTGVTGKGDSQSSEAEVLVSRLRSRTDLPICVGFGIRGPEDVRDVCRFADGAIVGSSLVEFLAEKWHDGAGRADFVAMICELKSATKK